MSVNINCRSRDQVACLFVATQCFSSLLGMYAPASMDSIENLKQ